MSLIGLDYDRTMSLDPVMWAEVIGVLERCGNVVKIVTSRGAAGENEDIERDAELCGVEIIYCNGRPKRSVFPADIWIDDSPEYIVGVRNSPAYNRLRYWQNRAGVVHG